MYYYYAEIIFDFSSGVGALILVTVCEYWLEATEFAFVIAIILLVDISTAL